MDSARSKWLGYAMLFVVQIGLLVLYWIFVRYDKVALPTEKTARNGTSDDEESVEGNIAKYPYFQDVHVMIFVGIAFLMTFLRKYGYSATGYTLLLAAVIAQWSILVKGFFVMESGKIRISMASLTDADFAAATPLISLGVVLGRTTPVQLLFMVLIEVALYAVNQYIQADIISITDVGGSFTVHAFGAYFGLAVGFMLRPGKHQNDAGRYEGPNYTSDIFSMVGTLFLWVYWPSFNSVAADTAGAKERAILNTYLSLAAGTVTTFIVSAFVNPENKLSMAHVQNATLAGGVSAGAICHLLIGSNGAILIGMISGAISVLGYQYLTPFLTEKIRLHDTCGVHNLHGMPAFVSAVASAVYASLATKEDYKDSMEEIFPAMANASLIKDNSTLILGGYGRTALEQGGYQLLGIAITVAIAIAGGAITGLIIRLIKIGKLDRDHHHIDNIYWQVSEEDPNVGKFLVINNEEDVKGKTRTATSSIFSS